MHTQIVRLMGAASNMTFDDWAAYLSVLNLNLEAKNKLKKNKKSEAYGNAAHQLIMQACPCLVFPCKFMNLTMLFYAKYVWSPFSLLHHGHPMYIHCLECDLSSKCSWY